MNISRRSIPYLAWVVLLTAAAYAAYSRLGGGALPDGLIQANGRLEGDHIVVASKVAGRINETHVREGDAVRRGQVLAVLDDAQVSARVGQAQAALAALDAQVQAARAALAVLRKEVPLAIGSAEAGRSRAQASLARAGAAEAQSEREAKRMRELVERGMVDRQRAEQAELALTVATSEHASARHALSQSEKQLADARLGRERIGAREAELAALKAQREQASATLAEARSVLADLTLRAPLAGVIVTRIGNSGEVVSPGSPVFDLVDLDALYLKVHIPEVLIGKLRLNLPARVYTDAFPNEAFAAMVRHIASTAEFTPKEVQTPDERVKLTYAVKLYLDRNPDWRLTPGLPADAVIRWKDGVEWAKPRW